MLVASSADCDGRPSNDRGDPTLPEKLAPLHGDAGYKPPPPLRLPPLRGDAAAWSGDRPPSGPLRPPSESAQLLAKPGSSPKPNPALPWLSARP
jgi:hypothetical protein